VSARRSIRILAEMRILFATVAVLSSLVVAAQQAPPTAEPDSVWFKFEWSQGVPWRSYSIQVNADGRTHFKGIPNTSQREDTDPVEQDFVISETNREEILDSAQKLNYFQGDCDSHLKHIAQTGSKTLAYHSGRVRGSCTYNYSQNATVQRLTRLFLGLATTLDYGYKLTWQYRYDKLGLNQQLRELEELEASHQVEELSIIEPILRKIVSDPNLMHISRQSAQRLLKGLGSPAVAPQSAPQP